MKKPIAYGRKSKLYQVDSQTILKLYDTDFPADRVHAEYEKTKSIHATGKLSVPKPLKEVTQNNQSGILYEKIDGIALMDLFQKKPWLYFSYSKKIVIQHKKVHGVELKGIASQQQEFTQLLMESDRLDANVKKKLFTILNANHEPVLCHGDFHHGNLIQTANEKIYIIDWMDAFLGCYKLDVALTAVNAAVSDSPAHVPALYRNVYEVLKKVMRLDVRYLHAYGLQDARDYVLLAAGIHLARAEEKNVDGHKKYFDKCLGSLQK